MEHPLLQSYRRDRRKLLEFILSAGLIKEVRTPSDTEIDLDNLSVDHVLDCVKSGGVINISEATRKYYDGSAYAPMVHSQFGNSYFLISDPDIAGSPPRRVPPLVDVNRTTNCASRSAGQLNPSIFESVTRYGDANGVKFGAESVTPLEPVDHAKVFTLGLPSPKTGLSHDNFRESAYEIFLASLLFSGVELHPIGTRRKEKSSKFLSRLKSKKDKLQLEFQPLRRHTELIGTVRVQMQISEAMDVCIRQRLIQFFARNMSGKIDVPRISLGLLSSISKSDFLNEKSYIQWKNRQANILEELLCFSVSSMTSEHLTVKSSLAKIKNSKEWDFIMSPTERDEVLSAITQIASKWSSLPGRFGIQCETCYWTAGYHLNIRIYEKLLFGVFDVLEEGELIAEADEILTLIKMSWSTLGITQRMHSALYGWVFFQQFIGTDETMLLENAIAEVQKVLSAEENDEKEELYLNSLVCSRLCNGIEVKLSLVQAIFFSMSIWCDSKLKDYHLHFSKKLACFGMVMTLASAVGLFTSNECSDIKSIKLDALNGIANRKLETYVERSIEAAYKRVIDTVDLESKTKRLHPLALLANELRLIVEREFTIFCPVIRNWCCEAGMISAMLLHRLYGQRLKPFLEGVSCLSEDVRSVLSAADMLDYDLTRLYTSVSQTSRLHKPPDHGLDHYQKNGNNRMISFDIKPSYYKAFMGTAKMFSSGKFLGQPYSFQRPISSAVQTFLISECYHC